MSNEHTSNVFSFRRPPIYEKCSRNSFEIHQFVKRILIDCLVVTSCMLLAHYNDYEVNRWRNVFFILKLILSLFRLTAFNGKLPIFL